MCGADGETYSNKCQLEREGCINNRTIEVDHAGECHQGMYTSVWFSTCIHSYYV